MNIKKLLAGILACCVVGGTLPSVERSADNIVTAAANEYTLGDVNGDGYLDPRDATIILKEYERVATGALPSLSENERLAADVNGDGVTDARDASIVLVTYASYGTKVSSEYQELFDISPNMNAPADGGFTLEEIENSPIKPVISASKKVITMEQAKENPVVEVSVDLSELGGNDRFWCSGGITIDFDSRLKPVLNNYGEPVMKGSAIQYLNATCNQGDSEDDSMKRLFIAAASTINYGSVGSIVGIKFRLPDDASYGDVYKIDIAYSGCEMLTNVDDDETGKLMQAYTFTQGIYNSEYNNNFKASYEDIEKCLALADIDGSCDGYIAIEDAPIMTTTSTTGNNVKVTLLGDANCDGQVTIADSTAILQALGNPDKYGLSEQGAANADCCDPGDGVRTSDALAIQKLDAKAIAKLPEITAEK